MRHRECACGCMDKYAKLDGLAYRSCCIDVGYRGLKFEVVGRTKAKMTINSCTYAVLHQPVLNDIAFVEHQP